MPLGAQPGREIPCLGSPELVFSRLLLCLPPPVLFPDLPFPLLVRRDNADPEAEARVAEAVRLEEEGRKRRAARMAMMAERGERQRQAARALRRQEGRRERRGRRRREQDAAADRRRRATGGEGRAKKRRRRVIEDSESDGEDEGLRQGPGAGVGASVRAVLTAGRLVASDGTGGGGSASGASGCAGVGPDGERHQAAVAEARRHLGGGGKRGWLA